MTVSSLTAPWCGRVSATCNQVDACEAGGGEFGLCELEGGLASVRCRVVGLCELEGGELEGGAASVRCKGVGLCELEGGLAVLCDLLRGGKGVRGVVRAALEWCWWL